MLTLCNERTTCDNRTRGAWANETDATEAYACVLAALELTSVNLLRNTQLGASSRAEVIRRALALMDRVSTSAQAGAEITIKSPKGEQKHLVLV